MLFAELAVRYPYGLTRPMLRRKFDARFPTLGGACFAGALRTLERAGLIERGEIWLWADGVAVAAINLVDGMDALLAAVE